MQSSFLTSENHYLRFSVTPSTKNELAIRKTIADALTQSFGLTSAATYVDVLWISEDGNDCVIRVGEGDATRVSAALASWTESQRLSLTKESSFLPSVLST
ncbi:hypothetical protein BDN70DRAFT_798198 [Pholiota conissans]|uniref:Ribonucleases P/MRP subunit Pop8-like domain-containing protein n=1 Tax=Pholiota conissans TaxID=109636 RepID=A0A9P5ZAN6_9AGAR|nr:hypothetical protein BDN70DRAFT_798198 [Pholiota conissans]